MDRGQTTRLRQIALTLSDCSPFFLRSKRVGLGNCLPAWRVLSFGFHNFQGFFSPVFLICKRVSVGSGLTWITVYGVFSLQMAPNFVLPSHLTWPMQMSDWLTETGLRTSFLGYKLDETDRQRMLVGGITCRSVKAVFLSTDWGILPTIDEAGFLSVCLISSTGSGCPDTRCDQEHFAIFKPNSTFFYRDGLCLNYPCHCHINGLL